MANEMKLVEDSTPVKVSKNNEITIVAKVVPEIDKEAMERCKTQINELSDELDEVLNKLERLTYGIGKE